MIIIANTEQKITFKISEHDKQRGRDIIEELNELDDVVIKKVIDHLDILYKPFKDHPGVTPEQAQSAATHFNSFVETMKHNIIDLKIKALKCINKLNYFSSDNDISSMIKSIHDTVEEVDNKEKTLENVIENLDAKDFQNNVISTIESIKKTLSQLKQLIEERILEFIRKNILDEDWTTSIKDQIKEDLEEVK